MYVQSPQGDSKHLLPPILTYVRVSANAFKSIYPPLLDNPAFASTLTPLTSGPLQNVRWVALPIRSEPCGALKGYMAPGDAHPCLALFSYLN